MQRATLGILRNSTRLSASFLSLTTARKLIVTPHCDPPLHALCVLLTGPWIAEPLDITVVAVLEKFGPVVDLVVANTEKFTHGYY
jgi:hypothetical protein